MMLDIPTIAVGEGLIQGPDIKHSFYLVLSSHIVYCQWLSFQCQLIRNLVRPGNILKWSWKATD